ncbi:hypothetical protein DJ64_05755 [Streptomyces griseorubens]|uniref:Transcription-repair coupling factor n=1 Tax=Streptomyces griseorubens TaxID=66897 RepID=A0ABR4T0X8_9ACTN|nr:hypothetical protein DJ64_05755 [Streptomyces griseorubens]
MWWAFKDLGLVIVDEEQRFGVEHKEQLKKLRANVDVLTMSATPIPRTLEMAVTGIREMSTITTPPEERHPVLTFVGPYDQRQIGAAIRRELLREGQVFYIHNRVESIDRAAARLREIVPEARIATAHGQMSEQALEQVVVDFWEKKFDVLVSTTIVESGIDISNANTLIVERGDNFGLSQLHQLRGRVGRGRERGYAYFLYPPEKPLTETAHERLATIAQHTEVGAGGGGGVAGVARCTGKEGVLAGRAGVGEVGAGVTGAVPRRRGAPRPVRAVGASGRVRGCTGVPAAPSREGRDGEGEGEPVRLSAAGVSGVDGAAGGVGRPAASRWMGGPTGAGAETGAAGDGTVRAGLGTATEADPSGGSTVRPRAGVGASPEGVRRCGMGELRGAAGVAGGRVAGAAGLPTLGAGRAVEAGAEFGVVARWTGAASGAGTARGRTGTSVTPGVPALWTAGVSGAAGAVARGAAPEARGVAVSGVLVRWTAGVAGAGGVVVRGGGAVEGAGAAAPVNRTGGASGVGGVAVRGEAAVVDGVESGALVRWTAGVGDAGGVAVRAVAGADGAVSGALVRWTAGVRDAGGVAVRGGVAAEGAGAGAPPRRTGAAADAGGMVLRDEGAVEVAGAATGAPARWAAGVRDAGGVTARGGVVVEAAGPDVLVR